MSETGALVLSDLTITPEDTQVNSMESRQEANAVNVKLLGQFKSLTRKPEFTWNVEHVR